MFRFLFEKYQCKIHEFYKNFLFLTVLGYLFLFFSCFSSLFYFFSPFIFLFSFFLSFSLSFPFFLSPFFFSIFFLLFFSFRGRGEEVRGGGGEFSPPTCVPHWIKYVHFHFCYRYSSSSPRRETSPRRFLYWGKPRVFDEKLRTAIIERLNYLDKRSEFWQQQEPLYSRRRRRCLHQNEWFWLRIWNILFFIAHLFFISESTYQSLILDRKK